MNIISVIVPVYNVELYIEDCLNSILSQNNEHLELILVVNNSKDKSLEICRSYASKYNCIKLIENGEPKGLSYARNVGLKAATGKYIWFVDSDDYIAPDSLADLYELMENNDVDGVLFDEKRRIEGMEAKKKYGSRNHKYYPFSENDILSGKDIFRGFNTISSYGIEAWRYFWKADYIKRNHLEFYNGILAEDNLFGFMALMNADRILYRKRDHYIYRMRDGSLMYERSELRIQSMFIVMSQILHYWHTHQNYCEDISKEIGEYLRQFVRIVFDEKKDFAELKEMKMGTDAERWGYNLIKELDVLEQFSLSGRLLSDKQIISLKNKRKIIVYGAGKYGKRVIEELDYCNIKYDIAVTERDYDISILNNHYIYKLDELKDIANEATVIIAVGKKNAKVMRNIAYEKGFNDYVFVEE